MLKELEKMDPDYMNQVYDTLKVTKTLATFNAFTGNDLRKIMRYSQAIMDCLPPTLSMEQQTRARQIITALDLLKQVQDCTGNLIWDPGALSVPEYEFRDNPVYFEEDGEDDEGDSEDDDT
ncbi:hypothetical protein DdX_18389 [Ditylenchus destructor]|uniref:Uncharacterized protein n=1 Tax=Ditylenchus destructor TaxID=166010 RepID=A0AAD4MMF3_9BILA|nr:hypothetical protein DdX_18389 [Ditylenchus destructor]